MSQQDKKLMSFQFYSSNIYNVYYRKYIKITEILASVGGLIKLFSTVFTFVNLYFSNIEKNLIGINELHFTRDSGNINNISNKLNISNNLVNNKVDENFSKLNKPPNMLELNNNFSMMKETEKVNTVIKTSLFNIENKF
jgi:hypothetical protein